MNSRSTRNISLILWSLIIVCLLVFEVNKGYNNFILITLFSFVLGFIGIGRIVNSLRGWFIFDLSLLFLSVPILETFDLGIKTDIKYLGFFMGILVAIELFFDDSIRNREAKKRCTVPFEAKCVSFVQEGISTYVPIYRYHTEGKTNTFYGNGLSSTNPKLGEIITVFVNKKNENDIYCPTAKAILTIRYLIGLLAMSFSVGAFVIL